MRFGKGCATMSNELKEKSLLDIRYRITYYLAWMAWILSFVAKSFFSPNYCRLIFIVVSLLIANMQFLFFAIGVPIDKDWLLSIWRIENNHETSESRNIRRLGAAGTFLGTGVFRLLWNDATGRGVDSLNYSVIVLGVYYTSRMITQAMGTYIYWIARLDNDSKLKTNASDSIILERSLRFANFNRSRAIFISVCLFIFVLSFSLAGLIWPITSAVRTGFAFYSAIILSFIVLSFIFTLIFDNNVILLYTLSQPFGEQYTKVKELFQSRLSFLKFIFGFFIFMEVALLIYYINI